MNWKGSCQTTLPQGCRPRHWPIYCTHARIHEDLQAFAHSKTQTLPPTLNMDRHGIRMRFMMVLMKQMAIISLGIFMCIEIMATSFTWIHLYVLGLNFIFTMQHEMIYSWLYIPKDNHASSIGLKKYAKKRQTTSNENNIVKPQEGTIFALDL